MNMTTTLFLLLLLVLLLLLLSTIKIIIVKYSDYFPCVKFCSKCFTERFYFTYIHFYKEVTMILIPYKENCHVRRFSSCLGKKSSNLALPLPFSTLLCGAPMYPWTHTISGHPFMWTNCDCLCSFDNNYCYF